ncbi:endospore germination permease [Priestia megaterium]|jgi:spore germination protein KB|uniref:endospore germination permease n=1 Tax=Priestia megaterium TaxID=1404 RepID=UPI003879E123
MGRITIPQLFTIFLLSTGLSNHVIVIPILLECAGRDAWISVIIGYFLILVFSLLILYISRRCQSECLFDWITSNYSKVLSVIIAVLFAIFLLVTGWVSLRETVIWTNETYLMNTPVFFIALFIVGASLYISYGKLNIIAICAGVLLPLVVLLGIFVAIGTIPDKDYHLITPVLVENGWLDVFRGSSFAFGSAIELFLIVMLQHQVTKELKFRHLIFLVIFLSMLTIGPLLGSIAIFGAGEAARLRYPAFFQWRILGFGNYFNHLDFLSIYQWMSGNFIRLAIILYLITQAFSIKRKGMRLVIQLSICILYILMIIVPISDKQFLMFLNHYYYLYSSIFGVSIIIFLALLIKTSKKKVSNHAQK